MTQLIWAPQAIEDVEAIRAHVARDSAHYAHLVVEIATVFHGARLFRLD